MLWIIFWSCTSFMALILFETEKKRVYSLCLYVDVVVVASPSIRRYLNAKGHQQLQLS